MLKPSTCSGLWYEPVIYFIGAIGMINSLRLLGYSQRVVLDRGLNKRQRKLLGSDVRLVTLPAAMQGTNSLLFTPYANLLHPQGIVVMLDSDLLVTRRLEAARSGQVCACSDPESDRWFPEWERLFKLPYRSRRQPFIDAGFLDFCVESSPHLLPRWFRLLTGTVQIAIDLQYSQEKAE
jgi:hypothetical protein